MKKIKKCLSKKTGGNTYETLWIDSIGEENRERRRL